MRLSKRLFIFVSILSLFSCNRSIVQRIQFDESRGYFREGKGKLSNPVRFNNAMLVDTTNVDSFRYVYSKETMRYDRFYFSENATFISNVNFQLALKYELLNRFINEGDFKQASFEIEQLELNDPDLILHSDLLYKKAYCELMLGDAASAEKSLQAFIDLSSKCYPAYFYGYLNHPQELRHFIDEKNWASAFLSDSSQSLHYNDSLFVAKYFHQNYLPGYTYNEDYLNNRKIVNPFGGLFGLNNMLGVSVGAQFKLNSYLVPVCSGVVGKEFRMVRLSLPLQVFKSKRNEFGLSAIVGNQFVFRNNETENNLLFSLGTGYFLNQKNSINALLKYSYSWGTNDYSVSYDISYYRHVLANLSWKAGVADNEFVIGAFLEGLQFLYAPASKTYYVRMVF